MSEMFNACFHVRRSEKSKLELLKDVWRPRQNESTLGGGSCFHTSLVILVNLYSLQLCAV